MMSKWLPASRVRAGQAMPAVHSAWHVTISNPSRQENFLCPRIHFHLLDSIYSGVYFFYRQVPRKPRLVIGDEAAQFRNNKIKLFALKPLCFARERKRKHQHFRDSLVSLVVVCFRDAPRCAGEHHISLPLTYPSRSCVASRAGQSGRGV